MSLYSRNVLLIASAALVVSGCSSAKKDLGLVKSPPDEFAVVKRAPLEMPPDYTLRPPAPGTPRPQEQAVSAQAKTAVLGADANKAAASGGDALLKDANIHYNPEIRQIVDGEAAKSSSKNEPVAKRLLNIGSDKQPAQVVDPVAEAQRLKTNAAQGKPPTAGDTPTIDDF